MINEAIKKLTEEAMADGSSAFREIEEHLTNLCKTNDVAEKILVDGKTIKGAYELIERRAEEMAKGKTGRVKICVSPSEGFDIVDDYFGINDIKAGKGSAPVIDVLDLL